MGTHLRPLNCPNCGAVINGSKCEYCGTTFFDFAELQIGKPAFMTIKIPGIGTDDSVVIAKALPVSIDISHRPDECPTLSIEFHIIPDLDISRRQTNARIH